MDIPELIECDVLIINCGIAGATAALRLSEKKRGEAFGYFTLSLAEDVQCGNSY